MNKQRGASPVYRYRQMRAVRISSKGGLKEHTATAQPLPSSTIRPNSQYMFKGHPLTFHSHGPVCDLLLSAKGFEEHSNPQYWGGSEEGSRR